MTANRELAKEFGLDDYVIQEIDNLHAIIDTLMKPPYFSKELTFKLIEEAEFKLQVLWGFNPDSAYHRYKHIYKLKSNVVGRKFKNTITGEVITIPENVRMGQCFTFKDGSFVDVGDGYYMRRVGEVMDITGEEGYL